MARTSPSLELRREYLKLRSSWGGVLLRVAARHAAYRKVVAYGFLVLAAIPPRSIAAGELGRSEERKET